MGILDGISWAQRHSAMKLDHFYYEDDFVGDVLRDEWNTAAGGTGVAPAVHATGEENGTVVGSTGATAGGTSTLNFNRVHFKTDLLAIIESRLKISDISEADAYFGFKKDADEYAYFHVDNGDIYCKSDDAGGQGPYSSDSLVNAVDNTYLVLTVELLDTETSKFYIDGILKKTSTTGAVTASLMDLYWHIVNTSNTDVSYTSDYKRIWQKRV
jgi:hypothetical protein